jgi:hypothetical protein
LMGSVKKVSVDDIIESGNYDSEGIKDTSGIEVWDNQPGGHVVKRYQENNVKYVLVEFNNSPGELYLYRQGTK